MVALLGVLLASSNLQAAKKSPTSKLYVADLEGQSEIDTGERIEELNEKSVHNAQGTVIQTNSDSINAMVFSNGTGVFLDNDSRLEIKRFIQEPFSPDRSDLEAEPSISQTTAFLPRGVVGLCTPRMVAGSSMNYATPEGGISIRGKNKVVIGSNDFVTKVSLVEGDVTIRSGANDGGGQQLNGGQQAVITRRPGLPPLVEIRAIPDDEREQIEDQVTLACDARKTVFFDVRGKKPSETPDEGDGTGWANVFEESEDEAGAEGEIVAIEVTPVEAVTETPVSASRITSG